MYIRASASIIKTITRLPELCKSSGEPVYLTKNGERSCRNGC